MFYPDYIIGLYDTKRIAATLIISKYSRTNLNINIECFGDKRHQIKKKWRYQLLLLQNEMKWMGFYATFVHM